MPQGVGDAVDLVSLLLPANLPLALNTAPGWGPGRQQPAAASAAVKPHGLGVTPPALTTIGHDSTRPAGTSPLEMAVLYLTVAGRGVSRERQIPVVAVGTSTSDIGHFHIGQA